VTRDLQNKTQNAWGVLVEVPIRSPPTKNKNITSSVASRVETKSSRFRSFAKITFVYYETASTVVRSEYGLLYYNTKIVPRYVLGRRNCTVDVAEK
jgi:hypothetical protein